jgi:hypothetical protein
MILGVVFDAAVGFIVGLPLLYMIGRNVPSYSSAPDVAMSVSEHMETGKQLHSSFQPRYLGISLRKDLFETKGLGPAPPCPDDYLTFDEVGLYTQSRDEVVE